MKTIATLVEQNLPVPGKTINESWFPLAHSDFGSAAEAIMWSLRFNVAHQNRLSLRVLERVATSDGRVLDHQIFPHWQPCARELGALTAYGSVTEKRSLLGAGSDALDASPIEERQAEPALA